jgi:hypothetical protein
LLQCIFHCPRFFLRGARVRVSLSEVKEALGIGKKRRGREKIERPGVKCARKKEGFKNIYEKKDHALKKKACVMMQAGGSAKYLYLFLLS